MNYKSKLFRESSKNWKSERTWRVKEYDPIENWRFEQIEEYDPVDNWRIERVEEYDPVENWSILSRRIQNDIDSIVNTLTKEKITNLNIKYVLKKLNLKPKISAVNYIRCNIKKI